jgi:hypothetical protein
MRTSNMPPGLRKYWQTHSRGGAKSHKRKHHSSGGGGAMVRYVPSAPAVRYKTRTKVIVKKSKSGGTSVMKREHGTGEMVPGPFRVKSAAVASLLGYSEAGKGAQGIQEVLNKLPAVGKLPKEALAGLAINFFADRASGSMYEWADAAAQALLDIGAYKVGQSGYALSGDDDD